MIDTKGARAEWTFPAEPGVARAARAAVCGRLMDWGLGELRDAAALLVSELVTNALRYAHGGPIGVRLLVLDDAPGTLRVEVSDPLPELPHRHQAKPDDEHGRGLLLLARYARRWGSSPDGVGKTVWFELAMPERAAHG